MSTWYDDFFTELPNTFWRAAIPPQATDAEIDFLVRTVGLRPMEYLLGWRMAVAKDLLRSGDIALDEVARRVGYGSASTFSTAFSRHAGEPPRQYARGREGGGGRALASAQA